MHLRRLARDGEDVSEFLRRLTLSDYFFDVRCCLRTKIVDGTTHVELVQFEVTRR